MSNYPLGAKDDPNAPYNEPLNKEHKRFVSVTISFYDTAYLPEDATEEQIKDELFSHIYNSKIPKEFDIDEFIILDE